MTEVTQADRDAAEDFCAAMFGGDGTEEVAELLARHRIEHTRPTASAAEAYVLEIDMDGQGVAYLDLVGRPHPTPEGAVQFARRTDAETYLEIGKDLWRLAGLKPYIAALSQPPERDALVEVER